MSLQFTCSKFVECPTCAAKPGSPALCRECLERRELHGVVSQLRRLFVGEIARLVAVCQTCNGTPNPHCKEHGR